MTTPHNLNPPLSRPTDTEMLDWLEKFETWEALKNYFAKLEAVPDQDCLRSAITTAMQNEKEGK